MHLSTTLKLAMCFVLALFLVGGVAAQCSGYYFEPSNGATWNFNANGGIRFDSARYISGGHLTCNNGFQAPATPMPSGSCYTMTTEQPWLYFQKLKTQAQKDAWNKAAAQFAALAEELKADESKYLLSHISFGYPLHNVIIWKILLTTCRTGVEFVGFSSPTLGYDGPQNTTVVPCKHQPLKRG